MKIKALSKPARLFFNAGNFNLNHEIQKARNPKGFSVLTYTAKEGKKEIFEELMKCDIEIDINEKDSSTNENSALSAAILFKQKEMINLILAQNKIDVDCQSSNKMTPLIIASVHGMQSVVKKLLKMKAKVNFQNEYGETALYSATYYGHFEIVQLMVEKYKADVNLHTVLGQTVLQMAIMKGHKKIAKFLIEHGATNDKVGLEVSEDGKITLAEGSPEVYKFLADYSPNPEKLKTSLGKEYALELCKAASEDDTDRIKELIKMGAEVNQFHSVGGRSCSALHFACKLGKKEAAKLLIEQGADINAKTYSGKTALELVKEKKDDFKVLFEITKKTMPPKQETESDKPKVIFLKQDNKKA